MHLPTNSRQERESPIVALITTLDTVTRAEKSAPLEAMAFKLKLSWEVLMYWIRRTDIPKSTTVFTVILSVLPAATVGFVFDVNAMATDDEFVDAMTDFCR